MSTFPGDRDLAREYVDSFYRTAAERENFESFWMGYSDGLDHKTEHIIKLHAPKRIRDRYLEGYRNGFYDRKRRETHSHEQLSLSVFRASSRATLEQIGMPWWANYTRTGGRD